MQIGLVGFAGAGRSTLFTALSGLEPTPPSGNLLTHTSKGVVRVPDVRMEWLRGLFKPKKYTPATVEFVDFAGIPRTAEKGKAELFAKVRECDALIAVVSDFDGAADEGEVGGSPGERLKALQEEFLFADLEIVERRIEKIEENLKKGKTKTRERDERELDLMKRCRTLLEDGGALGTVAQNADEETLLTTYRFTQQKPLLGVLNAAEGNDLEAARAAAAAIVDVPVFAMWGQVEAEIATMPEEERGAFLEEYGLTEPAVQPVIRGAFEATKSIPFFTVGEDEVRAWVIRRGDSALVAAGKIHSDIARGFIRGEVTAYEDLKTAGSEREAKAQNKMRLEGKEYVVQDGDIVHFRFSV